MSETDLRPGLSQVFAELEALKRDNSYLRMKIRYLESGGRDKCKVSKWTKVKGALGWEKEKEDLLTLKVPNSSSDPSSSISVSPAGSYMSHSSFGGQFRSRLQSSSSSEEDIQALGRRCSSVNKEGVFKKDDGRRSKSLDGETSKSLEQHIANKKLEKIGQKSHKTPWSKVKGIIQTKGVRKRSQEEKNKLFFQEHQSDEDDASKLNTPKLTLTLPSNEELCSEPKKRQDVSPPLSRKSKWFKVRSVFLQGSRSAPASPIRLDSFLYDIESDEISSGDVLEEKEDEVFQRNDDIRFEIERGYAQLQSRLTDEFSKNIVDRKRTENRDQNRERDLSPEFKKKLEEWDRIKQGKEPIKKDKDKKKCPERAKKAKVSSRQEVLIPTSTGMFRFEGISDQFTRRLYEWEQARGITPEESTFVLLDPEYKPSVSNSSGENGILVRSKSIGSIGGSTNGPLLVQQPSSLSLNDMDELQCNGNFMGFAEVGSDTETSRRDDYGYAPQEVTRLIDSSSGESDKDINHQEVVNSSYQLLQGNITLLDKLKKERDACRQLEDDMRLLEGQIYNVSKSFEQDGLKNSDLEMYDYDPEILSQNLELIRNSENNRIIEPVNDFTVKFDDFKRVETTMGEDLARGEYLYRYLPYERDETSVNELLRELLDLADQLESAVVERDKEMLHIKSALFRKQMESYENHFSSFTLPVQCLRGRRSQELSRLPKQLIEKLLELKQLINSSSTTDLLLEQPFRPPRILQRSIAHEDLCPDYRPPSQTSSSASSFSYLQGSKIQDSYYDYNKCNMVQESVVFDPSESDDESEHEVSSNVFVPTMRKIFSPVNENEAVSLVIEEEEEEEAEEEEEEEEDDEEEDEEKEQEVEQNNNMSQETEIKFKLKSLSSSPVSERKPQKYSSFRVLPENGIVNGPPLQDVEGMKLGDELSSSLKQRALRIQKAKEEFLKGRHNSVTIIVDDIQSNPTLLVKSASAVFISEENDSSEEKKNDSFLNLLKKKFKKEGAVASLARQAVETTADPSHTKSCPSSPVLNPKSESTSWIRNPAKKLFRPKGKYTINNK